MAQVGFIGLGIMGKPMARNLINAGYSLVVHDHKAEPMEELAAEGASMADSCRQASEGSEVIITMLPDSANSEDAILGQNGVLEGAPAGATIIDMSSINPIVSQKIGAEAAKHGVEMLDAPVSGGEPGAIAGTLAIMVGGNEEIFQKHEELLHVMGRSVVRVGEVGAGNVVKVANQMIVAANIEVIGEALALAQKAGIDPKVVFDAIRGGLAGSNCLEAKAPMMMERNFRPGFRIRLHHKDLNNAMATAKDLGVPVPVTSLLQQMLGALVNDGKGELDHSAIANFIEAMAHTEIRTQA